MKRDFQVIYPENVADGYQPGDEHALHAALALAQKADAPTINALSEMLTLLEIVGGQVHVTALRVDQDGRFTTEALGFHFNTADAKLKKSVRASTVSPRTCSGDM